MSTPESPLPFSDLPLRSAPALDLLAGVKVLDLTSSIAGPYAGQLLADMGATVVKVEKPRSGDDARAWGPPFLHGESLWFMSVNRGKQSLTLDIAAPHGQEVLKELVAQCDVILLNLVARAQRKLGLDAASLRPLTIVDTSRRLASAGASASSSTRIRRTVWPANRVARDGSADRHGRQSRWPWSRSRGRNDAARGD